MTTPQSVEEMVEEAIHDGGVVYNATVPEKKKLLLRCYDLYEAGKKDNAKAYYRILSEILEIVYEIQRESITTYSNACKEVREDKGVEEMVEEFERNHPGTMCSLIGADIKDWLRTTLTQYGNTRYEEGAKAERERVREWVNEEEDLTVMFGENQAHWYINAEELLTFLLNNQQPL